ncbi:REDY-like protein HapK [Aquisalinus flavus]|uniref:REDY-like protein HapK n=1 Tax=Aquisalinus flavus TaxID=1526572 RepID=A0A8J2Y845_9PROT|nr:REDY-like protein HapK [Aquisalinus flavus]MBD0425755.1 REDY-like protein HapK [Aquisalinus flavus]UNE48636.1 REDY-like protein HapK [Aquisalinus flavus]GGD13531.1 hypothetical protein GCM10011342_22870 [Aquisalinus flavus]
MTKVIIMYRLRDDVSKADFERWVRETDYPAMRGLSRVANFETHRTERLLIGEGHPSVAYVEIFEITDIDGFAAEDMPGETIQTIMRQFMGFADAPEFIIAETIG